MYRAIQPLTASTRLVFEFAGGTKLVLSVRELGCTTESGGGFGLFGSAWFQRYLIEFSVGDRMRVGFGKIDGGYRFMAHPPTHHGLRKLGFAVEATEQKYIEFVRGKRRKVTVRHGAAQFVATVGLGTPAQGVRVIIDTGSPMLAVRCDWDQMRKIVKKAGKSKYGRKRRRSGS